MDTELTDLDTQIINFLRVRPMTLPEIINHLALVNFPFNCATSGSIGAYNAWLKVNTSRERLIEKGIITEVYRSNSLNLLKLTGT